ncbi:MULTISPECIES: Eco57I restriction-modification methylase domain-containing protein [Haloferax]|uniref:Eco57I restriction-modification methylase domain-containing protein n=1 Tax=Haloferax TaxID=2251 RepID=UPI0017804F58|nr:MULTISPECIES: N-6 DNA methylase [Haloferax]
MDTDVFEHLERWVAELDFVEFADGSERESGSGSERESGSGSGSENESESDRPEKAAGLVNTFVYIQTLGDYGITDAGWLRETWERRERTHGHEGERAVLEAFFADVDDWLDSNPCVGLVTRDATSDIDLSASNSNRLYQRFERVLGVETAASDARPGITEYDFTDIDADVFGRIYERYLVEGREGHGVYYTPEYVSQSLVDDTVATQLRRLSTRIEDAVEADSWDDAETAVAAFTDFSILDPACGTGSFLVAAYATIREEYDRVFDFLARERQSRRQSSGETSRGDSNGDERDERLESLQKTLGYTEDDHGTSHLRTRPLVARIVTRHIHGIDLDQHALAIATLNVWLEAVEHDQRVASRGVSVDEPCVVTALDANLGCGDALVGLPDEQVRTRLRERHGDELEAVSRAREQFLEAPDDTRSLERAAARRSQIRQDLDATFEAYLEAMELPSDVLDETTPFYWPLQFWHVLGDGGGFDCVVGNPPWVIEGKSHTKQFLQQTYEHQSGQPDLYRYFLERSFSTTTGRLGMVTPNTWLSIPGARQLRRLLLCNARLEKIAFVPDSAFAGVGQNSIAVVVDKNTPQTDGHSADIENTQIRVGDIEPTGTFREVRTIQVTDIAPPAYHVNPYVGTSEKSVVSKMDAEAVKLREIADLTVGYQLYHRTLHSDAQIQNEVFHSETNVGDDYVTDTRADALTRYHLDRSKDRYVDTSAAFFRIPPRRFLDGEKLLVREVPSEAEIGLIATRSTDTLLFPKSVISVVLTDDTYDYEHLLGLLNSRLLYLASLVTGEKMSQDLFPRVSLTQLRGLPIEGTTELTPLVRKLERLAAERLQFRRLWDRHRERGTTETRSLTQILSEDGETPHSESESETPIVSCSVAPESDTAVLEREYSAFEVVGSTADPAMVVYGLEGSVEHELLRAEFRNRELLQVVYLSVQSLLESRAKVEHLGHVLEKTAVPVGEESPVEFAVHTIREVRDSFGAGDDWDDSRRARERDTDPADIVKIDDATATAQMELDAAVFDCYGLTNAEARTVLSVLDIRETVLEQTVAKLAYRQKSEDDA